MIRNIRALGPSSLVMATGRQTTPSVKPSIATLPRSPGGEERQRILPRRCLLCARTKITLRTNAAISFARGRCVQSSPRSEIIWRGQVYTRDGRFQLLPRLIPPNSRSLLSLDGGRSWIALGGVREGSFSTVRFIARYFWRKFFRDFAIRLKETPGGRKLCHYFIGCKSRTDGTVNGVAVSFCSPVPVARPT